MNRWLNNNFTYKLKKLKVIKEMKTLKNFEKSIEKFSLFSLLINSFHIKKCINQIFLFSCFTFRLHYLSFNHIVNLYDIKTKKIHLGKEILILNEKNTDVAITKKYRGNFFFFLILERKTLS